MSVRVDVLHTAECAQSAHVVEVIKREAQQLGVAIDLRVQQITSPRAASNHEMRGSPTVRVGGQDLFAPHGLLPPIGFT